MSTTILTGDCRDVLKTLPDGSVNCCVTSPPYWGLRNYGTAKWEGGDPACEHTGSERYYAEKTAATSSAGAFSEPGEANKKRLKDGRWREGGTCTKCGAVFTDRQIGQEKTPKEYVAVMVQVFREVRRVLTDDGTLWLNLGDSYAAQRGGTQMPAETLAGGKSGRGDNDAFRGRKAAHAGKLAHRDARAIGLKHKDLIGIPWRVAFALQADGWYLREDIIWAKPNCMPESVRDRCTRSHEYIFHFAKNERYYHDADAIKEPAIYEVEGSHGSTKARKARAHDGTKSMPTDERNDIRPAGFKDAAGFNGKHADKQRGHGRKHTGFNDRWDGMEKAEQCSGMRNKRSVWTVPPANYPEAHFATFPPALIRPCILAGCPRGGMVIDPFGGSGTTGEVAEMEGRNSILIELNPAYVTLAEKRTAQAGLFTSDHA